MTPAQQAKIDAAKATLDATTSAKDTAYSDMSSHYDSYMVNCKYKWSIPAKGQLWDAEGCDSGVNANQHVGCGSKQSCQSRVTEINAKVGTYNTALNAYNSAKANYDTVLNEIKNDPDVVESHDVAVAEATAAGKTATIKWALFGLAILMTIGGGLVIGWRTEIKKSYIILTGVGMSILFYVLFFGIGKNK